MDDFKPGLYRHYKGGLYRALFLATDEATKQPHVVYVALSDGSLWTRSLQDWCAAANYDELQNQLVARFTRIAD